MNGIAVFSLLFLAIPGATMFLLPYFTPRRFFFAVTVAPGFPVSEAGRSIMRGYHTRVAVLVALSALVVAALPDAFPAWGELLLGLGGGSAFLYARSKVSRY